jgi:hypothetical protein
MVRTAPYLLSALALAAPSTLAQDAPFNASLRDSYEVPADTYSDVWGDGTTAYIGRFGLNIVDVVDVSDPDNLSLLTQIVVPSPNDLCSAQDIKVGQSVVSPSTTLAFISFDASGPDGVGIYDVTTPASPTLLTTVFPSPGNYDTSHNTSYRSDGWLVTCNSYTADLAIIDLRTYDPSSPPASITSWAYRLTSLGTGFVHDITITDDYLFISQWDSLIVYDVSNLGTSAPTYLGEVRGYSNHAVWPTDDHAFVITTDERYHGGVRLWEFQDDGMGTISLEQWDSWMGPSSGQNGTYDTHNPVVKGDRAYVASYSGGTIVLQIDRTSKTLERVASFDSSSQPNDGYYGNWGVYPFLGEDRVLMSDLEEGLFTVDFSAIQLESTATRPKTVTPFTPTSVSVDVTALGAHALDGSSVTLYTSIDGGAFSATAMSNTGGDTYEASLPGVDCGARIDYYFAADETGGTTYTKPPLAPAEYYTTYSTLNLTTVLTDDFSTDKGWSVVDTAITTGTWERGTPVDTGMQPGTDDPRDAGNSCYITENGLAGGDPSANDLDGGPTVLTSPSMDFSGGDGLISYSLWLATTNADSVDGILVEVSNGGAWTTVQNYVLENGGWTRHCFRLSDAVTPTSTVQVRYSISDNPNDDLTEGGVDNFEAYVFCDDPAADAVFRNGGGSNSSCLTSDPVKIGATWSNTVDFSAHPGATSTYIVLYENASSGSFLKGGELLVDLMGPKLYQSLVIVTGGTSNQHDAPIPADVSFAGLTATVQGAIFGGGYELCNAYDLTVGF